MIAGVRTAEIIAAELIGMALRASPEDVAAQLVAEFEGLELKVYRCPANVPTIGCGRTRRSDGSPVTMDDPPCTREEAMHWLREDLGGAFGEVRRLTVPLDVGQMAALASLIFNIGATAFRNSTLRRALVVRNYEEAADQFLRWNKGGGRVLPGLVRRRRAERYLFKGMID